MALSSYDDLKVAIAEWLDRDDLTQFIDDFIDIAEARHRDEVYFREILSRDSTTLSDGDRTLALPSDFARLKGMRIVNPSTGLDSRYYMWRLVQLSEDEFVDKATVCEGPPKYVLISEQMEFDTEADQDYTVERLYYKTMTPLASANQSNELLVRAADVYLYGALSASAPYLLNDERLNTWETLYNGAVNRVNLTERTGKTTGPQVARVKGV